MNIKLTVVAATFITATFLAAGAANVARAEGAGNAANTGLDAVVTLTGVARDEAGKPVAGVLIDAGNGKPGIKTDAAGRFTILGLKAGAISLSAGAEWDVIKPRIVTPPFTEPLVVTLRRVMLAPLRGRVVNDKGAPVENATVTIRWQFPINGEGDFGSQEKRIQTDVDGRYEVTGIRVESQVTTKASKPRHRLVRSGQASIVSAVIGVNGAPMPNPNPVFEAGDMVLLPLEREATGRVVDAAGQPVANALVGALGGGQEEREAIPRNIARTDAEGRFTLRDLPEGELGFVAGAGDGFVQVRSGSTKLGDLVLRPQTRPARDLPLAKEIVINLIQETRNDDFWRYYNLADILAPYDYNAALDAARVMEPNGTIRPYTLCKLVAQWIRHEPEKARAALPTLLPELERGADEGWFASFILEVTRLVPQPERETVAGEAEDIATLRSWVRRQFAQSREQVAAINVEKSRNEMEAYRFMALAALGWRLGNADAEGWARDAIAIMTRSNIFLGAISGIVEGLARGGAGLVEKTLDASPPENRAYVLSLAVRVLARNNLAGAQHPLDLLASQLKREKSVRLNAGQERAFGMAVKAIIACMDTGHAAEALALARRVESPHQRPEALALAARLQPKAEAAVLLREAFDLQSAIPTSSAEIYDLVPEDSRMQTGLEPGAKPGVVGIALGTDSAIGDELIAKIEDRFFDLNQRNRGSVPSSVAMYLTQTQPGRARAWMEWEWAASENAVASGYGRGKLRDVAALMSAVDTQRALEMAGAIPPKRDANGGEDVSWRWDAQRKIAEFVAAPEETRRSLNFNLQRGSDSWSLDEGGAW